MLEEREKEREKRRERKGERERREIAHNYICNDISIQEWADIAYVYKSIFLRYLWLLNKHKIGFLKRSLRRKNKVATIGLNFNSI